MKSTEELLNIASKSRINVLLQGESGTGKEVAARFLHNKSDRKNGPFIALNCGAIAKNLIESILEGSKKGSFTGSLTDQIGVVRASHGGTLFLDEIGEMPLDMQSRLLRILQERAVLPLGATKSIVVDFRLICATNKNLHNEVYLKNFREDLFFRLNAFPIMLKPLREREDFEFIAQNLWQEILLDSSNNFIILQDSLTNAELVRLRSFNWPGNIRQLKNVLERYSLLKPHGILLQEILNDEFSNNSLTPIVCENKFMNTMTPPWSVIEQTLDKFRGNKMQAARALGISRSNLYIQIKKRMQNINFVNSKKMVM